MHQFLKLAQMSTRLTNALKTGQEGKVDICATFSKSAQMSTSLTNALIFFPHLIIKSAFYIKCAK